MEDVKLLRKRLLYQSQHRGMREMDLLLGQFAEKHIPFMDKRELKQFETLLACPDQTLHDWLFGKILPPKGFLSSLLLKIQKLTTRSFD